MRRVGGGWYRVLTVIAKPRGFCAGVERAIRIVELALERYGPPVYVRKEIVHNTHVVRRLAELGAIFVDELDEVPAGAVTIYSAHGSPPSVYRDGVERELRVIDATCPLVTKVHAEVKRYVKRGYRILLIGHAGHDEVIGTLGQAPESTTLIETTADAEALQLEPGTPGVILTQTTLSQDDTAEIVAVLQRRYPSLELPPSDDICYATQNRQNAVKQMSPRVQLLLVVGSRNSSNSQRLTEVARARGVRSHLIDGPADIDPAWLEGVEAVGLTSGASAPEDVVQGVLARLKSLGARDVDEIPAPDEGVVFALPPFLHAPRNAAQDAPH
ncbi:MAG: 4-hydroxy-3-methylbut-2-enyl diphosphate reductase [Phycisphaerales bacterium]|nr:4-hydroxy-3-methylbut-2-enyl diphosphate reductase [Phycisphaerales bacterium]